MAAVANPDSLATSRPSPPQLGLVGPVRNQRRLAELQLVLKSLGIEHGISAREGGFYFVVDAHKVERTQRALVEYEQENQNWPPRPARRDRLAYSGSPRLSFFWAALLGIVFLFSGPVATRTAWFMDGISSSERVMHGEAWRTVTALTLHADAAHLLGNVAVGGVFLWAASARLGYGRAALFTLLGGTVGNLANAVAHRVMHAPHSSLGASTAVFATVGLLVGTQVKVSKENGSKKWTDRVGPWVGGAALLGMLGASAQADLWAHFYGLAAGAALGLVASTSSVANTQKSWVQPAYAAATVGILGAAWALAFAMPPV